MAENYQQDRTSVRRSCYAGAGTLQAVKPLENRPQVELSVMRMKALPVAALALALLLVDASAHAQSLPSDGAVSASNRRLLTACTRTIPWSNPNMLADYKVRKYIKTSSAGRRLAAMSVVYPYRKFVKMDPETYQWDYKSITLKRGCKLKLDWNIPVNTGAAAQSRGVAMSRISVCNITKGRYTYLKMATSKSSYSITLRTKGVYYFWDSYGRKPGQLTPSQTPYPYDQFWPRCQFGVFIAVRVL